MSSLLPEGCSLGDAPYNLAEAIGLALRFLKFEELDAEDVPPTHIWFDGEKMSEHWAGVRRRQEEKYGVKGQKEIEGDTSENEAVNSLIID